jgi:hypothetical protein
MPDGEFLPPFDLSCVETAMKQNIAQKLRAAPCACTMGAPDTTKTNPSGAGEGPLPGKKSLHEGLSVWWLFQFGFFYFALGATNR